MVDIRERDAMRKVAELYWWMTGKYLCIDFYDKDVDLVRFTEDRPMYLSLAEVPKHRRRKFAEGLVEQLANYLGVKFAFAENRDEENRRRAAACKSLLSDLGNRVVQPLTPEECEAWAAMTREQRLAQVGEDHLLPERQRKEMQYYVDQEWVECAQRNGELVYSPTDFLLNPWVWADLGWAAGIAGSGDDNDDEDE
jgi:hypothetical protein